MKFLHTLALVTMTASAVAVDATFYLGTYTKNGRSKGIYVGKLDTESGRLGEIQLAGEAKSPSSGALSPDRKLLYAARGAGSVGAGA